MIPFRLLAPPASSEGKKRVFVLTDILSSAREAPCWEPVACRHRPETLPG